MLSAIGTAAVLKRHTHPTAVLEELERAKPSSAKGRYFRRITLSSTMGPGVKIDTQRMFVADEA